MKKLIAVAFAASLAACATNPVPVTVKTVPAVPPAFTVPVPRPPHLGQMKFRVLNAGNIDAFVADFKKTGGTIYILDTGQMRIMTQNLAELKRYVKQQKTVIITLQNEMDRLSKQSDK